MSTAGELDRLDDELSRYRGDPGYQVAADARWHKLWGRLLRRVLRSWVVAEATVVCGLVTSAIGQAGAALLLAISGTGVSLLAAAGGFIAWGTRREQRHVAHCPTLPPQH